ncbi:MAG: DNA-directed RNA polymerase subunit beta [Paenibacillaceae bacterium]
MANQTTQKPPGWVMPTWLRIILSILRFLLIPALCVVALFVGLTIGYATIGGGEASDVFQIDTWKHLYNLVFAE